MIRTNEAMVFARRQVNRLAVGLRSTGSVDRLAAITASVTSPALVLGKTIALKCADVLMPALCVSCHQPLATHDSLCAACWRNVRFLSHPLCDKLGIPLPFDPGGGPIVSAAAVADPPVYDRARAAMHFSGVGRELVHRFKYGDQHTPRWLFRRLLIHASRELAADCDVVMPVPLHHRRLWARRFNQSAILAGDLAVELDLDYWPQTLVRQRATAAQVGLTRDQRQRNLRGAFAVHADRTAEVFGRSVLLVDDVITTGTTAQACARVLKRAGARRVDVVALAMVTDDSRINP